MKRILAIIIASFFLLSTFIPFCFADYSSQPRGFWDVALYKLCQAPDAVSVDIGGFSLNLGFISGNSKLNSHLSENICSDSSDHLHHADSLNEWQGNNTLNEHGSYAYATCKFCGKTFKYYSDDLQQDYQTYLHDNNLDNGIAVTPATDDSPSGFVWYPTVDDFDKNRSYFSWYDNPQYLSHFPISGVSDYHYNNFSFRFSGRSIISTSQSANYSTSSVACFNNPMYLVAPLSGTYTFLPIKMCDGSNSIASGSSFFSSSSVSVSAGSLISFDYHFGPINGDFSDVRYIWYFPCFSVVPDSSTSSPSVPSTITINNNTYPVVDIDFNSRTVHVEDNRTIIYDDDKIIIKEGDTIIEEHNYYIEDDDPGPDPGNGDDSSTSQGGGTVDPGDASGSGGSGCCEQCALLLRQVNSYLLQIQTLVDQINDKLGPESDNYMEGIYNLLVEINTALDNLPTEPHKDYEAKLTTISNQLANIWGDLDTIKTSLSAVQSNTATTNQKLDTVHADLQAVLSELQTQRGILSQILSVLRDILSHVITIDKNVDELSTEEQQQDFIHGFIGKFSFINQIYQITVQMIRDVTNDAISAQAVSDGIIPSSVLSADHASPDDHNNSSGDVSIDNRSLAGPSRSGPSNPTAPEVMTQFPDVEVLGFNLSQYSALDMSWYAPYKSEVDVILSGFMYLGYLWLLFKRLPSIIRGGAMASSDYDKVQTEFYGKKGD